MIKVIGVRFRTAGKIYFFDPLNFQVEKGGHVIVETARGIEFGTVVSEPKEVEDDKVIQPLKPVLRIANQRDIEQEATNKQKEREAFRVCLEKIRKHGLEMKLIDAEYTFDNNKVLFYFTADGRIDFRELVKDLAGVFKTRIELRQIGVRDETKVVGGIGTCGRPLCCHTHLSEFVPVSIKMAKEQNLSLNPTKISGVCGRLMCCLKHESDTYEELNRRLPCVGDYVTAEDGTRGEVQSVNVLRQLVKVIVDVNDEKEIHEYKVGELHFKRRHTKKERLELSAEELAELERLEAEDQIEIAEEKGETAGASRNDGAGHGRDNRNGRDNRGRDARGGRDNNRDNNDNRNGRDNRNRDSRGGRDNRYSRDNRGGAENREGNNQNRNRFGGAGETPAENGDAGNTSNNNGTDNRQDRRGNRNNRGRDNRVGRDNRPENRTDGAQRTQDADRTPSGENAQTADKPQNGDRAQGGERQQNGGRQQRNNYRSRNRHNFRNGKKEGNTGSDGSQS